MLCAQLFGGLFGGGKKKEQAYVPQQVSGAQFNIGQEIPYQVRRLLCGACARALVYMCAVLTYAKYVCRLISSTHSRCTAPLAFQVYRRARVEYQWQEGVQWARDGIRTYHLVSDRTHPLPSCETDRLSSYITNQLSFFAHTEPIDLTIFPCTCSQLASYLQVHATEVLTSLYRECVLRRAHGDMYQVGETVVITRSDGSQKFGVVKGSPAPGTTLPTPYSTSTQYQDTHISTPLRHLHT
eukprot:475423-Rhodomonas_salina.1